METPAEIEVTQTTWGSAPFSKRAKPHLLVPAKDSEGNILKDEDGEIIMIFKKEIRPKDLARSMGISRGKASMILEELQEYEKVVLRGGSCKYVRVS